MRFLKLFTFMFLFLCLLFLIAAGLAEFTFFMQDIVGVTWRFGIILGLMFTVMSLFFAYIGTKSGESE